MPREAIIPIMPRTTITSIIENPSTALWASPLSRSEVLGDGIDRGDYGDGDKADQKAHRDHHRGLDEPGEALGLLVELLFVNLREISERIGKISGGLADGDHIGQHGGEEFRIFF